MNIVLKNDIWYKFENRHENSVNIPLSGELIRFCEIIKANEQLQEPASTLNLKIKRESENKYTILDADYFLNECGNSFRKLINDFSIKRTNPIKVTTTITDNQEVQELRNQLARLQVSQVQAPSKRIWVRIRGENQAISLSQKHLEGVELADDLKGAIKEHLDLENVPKKRITIYRGEDLLKNSTSIDELYNTEEEALEVVVDEGVPVINLIVNVPGEKFHFRNQRIGSPDDVIELIKSDKSLLQFIADDTIFLGSDKQPLDQRHITTAQEFGTLNITLSSPDVIDTKSGIHRENLEKAFNVDYVDNNNMIEEFLFYLNCKHKDWSKNTNHHVPYSTIFQSSGYGKSRLIKEVAKQIPTVYLCLRDENSTGYPPRTSVGADLFERLLKDVKEGEEWRFLYILQVIIQCFNEELTKCDGSAQTLWNNQMNASFCEKIWNEIKRRSENWKNIPENEVNTNIYFITNNNNPSDDVRFLFCIDEARALISPSQIHKITPFRLFRRALRKVKWNGFFTLLLDTLSKISNFAPPKSLDPSHRDIDDLSFELELFYPYIQLTTMDVFYGNNYNNSKNERTNLAKYGRPLYMSYLRSCPDDPQAIDNLMNLLKRKLLGGANNFETSRKDITSLAILSSLIGIDISPQSQLASELVASHMATCLAVSEDRERLIIVYPSEPLLSEAAFELMSTSTLPQILNQFDTLLRKGIVEPGPRGEIVARIILVLIANKLRLQHDRAENSVREFLKELYSDEYFPDLAGVPQELLEGKVAFTHFNSVSYTPAKRNLKQFYKRRCAFIMKRNQRGVDICIPIKLTSNEYSVILIQIKNIKDHPTDKDYSASARSMFNYNYVFKGSDLQNHNKPCVGLYWQLGYCKHFAEVPKLTITRQLAEDDYRRLNLCWATSGLHSFRISDDISGILQNILVSHITPFENEWKANTNRGDWKENRIKIMHPLEYDYEGYHDESDNDG